MQSTFVETYQLLLKISKSYSYLEYALSGKFYVIYIYEAFDPFWSQKYKANSRWLFPRVCKCTLSKILHPF